MEVANPIYDVVFKYLLEDVRVARIILSALLKQEVLSVEPRAHEYTGKRRHDLSMYRVDFAARVRQDDGTEKPIEENGCFTAGLRSFPRSHCSEPWRGR